MRRLLPCAIALVVSASACAGGSVHTVGVTTRPAAMGTEEGSIRGIAMTPSFGGSQPFPPAVHWALRVSTERHLVRIVRTDAHGRFATRLPAGWYVIRHPDTASDRFVLSPARFRITPRATTRLTIAITATPLAAIRRGGSGTSPASG